ncbi:GH25 family lysozyme, partial [Lacticaseibacillus hulanensis]|uniref:GH25 family lysozyme n=1 Tax=Lacticaseibacillus hulanensis TaxID=2493111 RepID=UPI000FDAEF1C
MKSRLINNTMKKKLGLGSVLAIISIAALTCVFNGGPVKAADGTVHVVSSNSNPTTVTSNQATVLNSHSDLEPESSIAYVASDIQLTTQTIKTTPLDSNSKVDTIFSPAGLTQSEFASWLSNAKKVALLDFKKTGRVQKIVMVDATAKTITIGATSIPEVSAIDVARYQSWMTQADFDTLAKLGVKAVVVKVTESTSYKNPYAASQISMAKKAGMMVSVYHFAHFNNASSAKAEATYTANVMDSLGLPKSTRVFADMESPDAINRSNVVSNMNQYYSTLNSLGYTVNGLYTGAKYKYSTKMINAVGAKNTWIASYPINPSSSDLQHTGYGAWQFSCTALMPGSGSNYIDVSHDYNGLLTDTDYDKAHIFNKYVTVTRRLGSTYSDFNWNKQTNLSNLFNRTLLAKKYFHNQNGATYYSLYDNAGKFQGYVNAGFTKVAGGQQGVPLAENKYVTVNSKSGTVWAGFNHTKMTSVASYYEKTFQVKVKYNHFSGAVYYSLYDNSGKWKGYINSCYTTTADGEQGTPLAENKFVTVMSKKGTIWANFSHKVMANMSAYYQKTFQVKVKYNHLSGAVYYSLYDNNGKWKGYINSGYIKTADGEQGTPLAENKFVTVMSKKGTIWANFSHKV